MQNSIGIDSIVLVREASIARRPAAAFSYGVAGTRPSKAPEAATPANPALSASRRVRASLSNCIFHDLPFVTGLNPSYGCKFHAIRSLRLMALFFGHC